MGHTTTAELADTIPTIIEQARFTEQFKAIMSSLVWRATKKLHEGSTKNFPIWGTVTAQSLTEGVDMVTAETMEDTLVTITPAEVGCKIILTDKLIRDNQEDVKRAAGRILGDAMEYKRDYDQLLLLDNGTNSLCGTGTTLTLGHIAAARALLEGNAVSSGGPAPTPYAMVHHPYVLLDIVDVFTPIVPTATYFNITGSPTQDEMLRQYLKGAVLFDIPVYADGNIPIDATPDAKGGIFSTGEGGAIILVTAKEWDVEPQRDASLRAWELNIVGEYGVGNYLNAWTAELYCDATTPA